MEERLKKMFADLFSLSEQDISEDSSINNVEKWSSLMHFKLIASLEEEFKVQFNEDEILNLTSFGKIFKILNEKIPNEKNSPTSF